MAFPQSVKDAVKRRSGGRCECRRNACSHSGRCTKGGVEYNHIKPQRTGGSDTLANCELLYAQCHKNTRSYGVHK